MGSWADLTNEQLPYFQACIDELMLKRNYVDAFAKSELVELFKLFDGEILTQTIHQCCANDWMRPLQWKHLATLYARYGVSKTDWAIERMNGRQNFSIDTVEGILKNEIAARRKVDGDKAAPTVRKPSRYPLSDGRIDQTGVTAWLIARGHTVDRWAEFFDRSGFDPEFASVQLYKLKEEYR